MMNDSTAITTMLLLFALRCILPLALTMVFAWAMDRLVAKWDAEDSTSKGLAEGMGLPVLADEIELRPSMAEMVKCWVFHDCGRTDCAAYENPELLCWKIKSEEAGRLPAACANCAYYELTVAVA